MRVDSWLKIEPDDGLNYDLLMTKLTVPNPEFQSRLRLGYSTNGVRRFDNLYQVVGNELWVPRALAEKYVAKGKNVVDCMSYGHEVDFKSRIQLGPNEKRKEEQKPFVDALTEAVKNSYGAIGQAEAGFGKTVCALEVVARLGRTTAVLVHKEFLMNQWAERVMECYDIDESEIGFVQQDVCDYEGKKIVMIMVQSLLAREYPEELFKYFGMIVVDEVHRFGAVEFRKAITMFPGRYRLGVTATPRRADGLERVFFWHIGDIAAVGAKRSLKPRIEMVRTNVKPSDLEFRRMKDFRGELTMNKVLDWLVTSEERNRLIVQLLLKAARSGRKVLLLSGRREHLNVLRHMTKSEMAKSGKQFSTGLYVGGMTDEQRSVSAEKQIIFGTYNMAAEGLDIPELDTLFLATPKGDVEQSVGRILRTADEKKEPVVVDFVDYSIGLCIGLSKKRLKQYQELGYVK